MQEISEKITDLMGKQDVSYRDLAKITSIPTAALQRYATGGTRKIPLDRVEKIASALHVSAAYLLGWDATEEKDNKSRDLETHQVPQLKPLYGNIACGTPIFADDNIEEMIEFPSGVHADFALRCTGDSMINARIYDGDIVYIRKQDTVENGEIAAVLIENEATLKRVRLFDDHVVLQPENPMYRPFVFWGDEMNTVHILGLAVAFTGAVK